MTKSTDFRDPIRFQCSKGQRTRHVNSCKMIVASARTSNTAPARIMATLIQGETEVIPIFTAPCNLRVVRIYANGTPFVDNDIAQTTVATTYKSAATALGAGITIGSEPVPTANTALDDVLVGGTTMDVLEGQHIYTTVVVGAAVQTAVAYVTVNVEWVPTEQ
ncbi:MAG: hypothetical protein ABIH92_03335 [Nanoarchaeota archaeon]